MVLLTKEGGGDEKRGLFKRQEGTGVASFPELRSLILGCKEPRWERILARSQQAGSAFRPLPAFSLQDSSVRGKEDVRVRVAVRLASRIKGKQKGFEEAKLGPPGASPERGAVPRRFTQPHLCCGAQGSRCLCSFCLRRGAVRD